MTLLYMVVLFAVGLGLIIKGGDWFVDAAVWLAGVLGVPQFLIGATVVSVATTLPELTASAIAAFEGKVDMAVGNAVGSVTVNVSLILGVAVLGAPFLIRRSQLWGQGALLAAGCLVALLCSLRGSLSTLGCVLLLLLFFGYVTFNIYTAKKERSAERPAARPGDKRRQIAGFLLGAAGIVVGAKLLVYSGSGIARMAGVPEAFIAVTIISFGTSLPEFTIAVTAAVKKHTGLSAGNIVGAGVIDITLILPLCAVFSGRALPISPQGLLLDMPVSLVAVLVCCVPALLFQRFRRWQGACMVGVYVLYVAALLWLFV